MLTSLALIFLVGLALAALCQKLKLPRIIGMLATGMGAVLAAVSPAVVVPRMVQLMESGRGTDKSIPQMILAGASCDDIFVIVLFTTFLHTAQGGSANAADFLSLPASCSALRWVRLSGGCSAAFSRLPMPDRTASATA